MSIRKNQNYKIVTDNLVNYGRYGCRNFSLKYRLFNGKWSKIMDRSIILRPRSVGAILYDPVLRKIVLIEQFRSGALWSNKSPWMIEIIAGENDLNVTPIQSITREIEEEVGITNIYKFIHIYNFLSNPCITNEIMQLFCVLINISDIDDTKYWGNKNEGEDIKIHVLTLDEALRMINEGVIWNSATIIALQWLTLNEKEINI